MIYKNLSTDEIMQLEFQAGKKATELIDGIKEDMKGKLDAELSAADNGKILQVGADGKVTPMAPASGLTIDDTLSVQGAAADAKAAGEAVADLKTALLACTPGNFLLSQILCPDFEQLVQGRRIYKKGNVISAVWTASNNKPVYTYITGTVNKIGENISIPDLRADLDQLVDLNLLGSGIQMTANIQSNYTGTVQYNIFVDYYKIVDGAPERVSYQVLEGGLLSNYKGIRVMPFEIPDGATHFALGFGNNGAGASYTMAIGFQKLSPIFLTDNVETALIASKNYVVNSFLYVNSRLYRITSPVSRGENLIVGTNMEETTIGGILTTILNAQ